MLTKIYNVSQEGNSNVKLKKKKQFRNVARIIFVDMKFIQNNSVEKYG